MAYFVRYDENLSLAASAVTITDEDPAYLATNLLDPFMVKPVKSTATSCRILFGFSEPVAPKLVSLIGQYLDAGLSVRIQGNDSDDFSSPAFDEPIVIPAKLKSGPSYQPWTVNPWAWIDPDGAESYAFWSVDVQGTNSQPVHIQHVVLASGVHRVTLFHDGDLTQTDRAADDPGQKRHRTQLGVDRFVTVAGPRRGLGFVMIGTDLNAGTSPQQDAQDFRDLCEATDGAERPFLFIPFETNDAWLVRPEGPEWSRSHRQGGYQVWSGAVREVARPLPFP